MTYQQLLEILRNKPQMAFNSKATISSSAVTGRKKTLKEVPVDPGEHKESGKDLLMGIFKVAHQYDWDYAITLNTNKKMGLSEGAKIIRTLCMRVDRKLVGNKYTQLSLKNRTHLMLFPAYGLSAGNLHYHGLLKLPIGRKAKYRKAKDCLRMINDIWVSDEISNGGTCDTKKLSDLNGWLWYVATEKTDPRTNKKTFGKYFSEYVNSHSFIGNNHK